MKFWECTAFGSDWDAFRLMVGESEEEIKERWSAEIEEGYGWVAGWDVKEVKEVDGYKITLSK